MQLVRSMGRTSILPIRYQVCRSMQEEAIGEVVYQVPKLAAKLLDKDALVQALKEAELRGATVEEAMSRFNGRLNRTVVSCVLREVKNVDMAMDFFDWAGRQADYRNDSYTYTLMLHLLARCKRVGEVNAFFKQEVLMNCRPNKYTYCILMRAFCNAGLVMKGFKILNFMKKQGVIPDVATYNVLLHGLCRIGRPDRALRRMQIMSEKCEPNAMTYNIIINGLCKRGCVERAVFLFNRMIGKQYIPLSDYGKKSVFRAAKLFQSLPQVTYQPTVFTYGALISGLCMKNRIDDAYLLYLRMAESNLEPDTVIYNTLVFGLCKNNRVDEALELLKEMINRGCKRDVITYSTIIDGVCKKRSVQEAYVLFNEMIGSDCPPNIVTYNMMIHGLCDIGEVNEGLKLLRLMVESGDELTKPNNCTYCSLISGLARVNRFDDCCSLFDEMQKKQGLRPDMRTFTALIYGLCKAGRMEDVAKYYRLMLQRRRHPSVLTFRTMIKGFTSLGLVDDAITVFKEMIKMERFPDKRIFDDIVDCMVRLKRPERYAELFVDMIWKGQFKRGEKPMMYGLTMMWPKSTINPRTPTILRGPDQCSEPFFPVSSNPPRKGQHPPSEPFPDTPFYSQPTQYLPAPTPNPWIEKNDEF